MSFHYLGIIATEKESNRLPLKPASSIILCVNHHAQKTPVTNAKQIQYAGKGRSKTPYRHHLEYSPEQTLLQQVVPSVPARVTRRFCVVPLLLPRQTLSFHRSP